MQRHILRNLPRVEANTFARATAITAAQASPMVQFSTKVSIKQTNLLINGEFLPSSSGRTFETSNPAMEEKIADVSMAGNADIDAAVAAARDAFEGPWANMSAEARGKLVYKLADLIEENIGETSTRR